MRPVLQWSQPPAPREAVGKIPEKSDWMHAKVCSEESVKDTF